MMIGLAQHVSRSAQELLVKFKSGIQPMASERSLGSVAGVQAYRVPLVEGSTAAMAMATWRQDSRVVWVQPNAWRYTLASEVVPNDPYYRPERNARRFQQWHLPKINANNAWSVTTGSAEVIVAVIDSGVDLNHPDLKEHLLPGVSIVHQDHYTPPSDGMDDNGHGTHIAGLIAAMSNNSRGVCGTNWNARLLPIKVLNNNGEGTDSDIIAGIYWAVNAGARILNMSFGAPGEVPAGLQEAITYAHSHHCLLIAASGNSGDSSLFYPAALDHVLAVAATDPFDQRAVYSTFNVQVDLAAPGGLAAEKETGILSTFWDSNSVISDTMSGSEAGEYAIAIGTSMAAGIISGAAALVASYRPELDADGVADLLIASGSHAATPNPETGAGVIDLLKALQTSPSEPSPFALYFYPNPFNPSRQAETRIVFFLDEPQSAVVKIYDASRDLVWEKKLDAGETLTGKNYLVWNGRNAQGQGVANGAYFCRVSGTRGRASAVKVLAVLR